MSERVAVTGASGMLGRELLRAAAERGASVAPLTHADCDVADEDGVLRAIGRARPAVVIHAAAWTDVDGCEGDPERAFRVNGRGARNVAQACRETGARMILVSTDYVFPGDSPLPYGEEDPPGPLSVYGWSKLLAEETVRELGDGGAIVRTAWLYADHGRNFLRTMLRLARERDTVNVVDDQRGSPTFAADLADALWGLAESGASGVFHVTNGGSTTWHGFAARIFREAGIHVRCEATTSDRFPSPASRPANSILADHRLASAGVPPLPAWEDALDRCLARGVPGKTSPAD